jgi:hypothetical protein
MMRLNFIYVISILAFTFLAVDAFRLHSNGLNSNTRASATTRVASTALMAKRKGVNAKRVHDKKVVSAPDFIVVDDLYSDQWRFVGSWCLS